jgi:hypothetical protein
MLELEKYHHQRLPGEAFLPKVDSHRNTAAETESLPAVVVVAAARQEPERARIEQQYKDQELVVVEILEEQTQTEQLQMACQLVLAKAWWPQEEVLVEELLEHSTLRLEHRQQVSRLEAWRKSLARLRTLAWRPYFLL